MPESHIVVICLDSVRKDVYERRATRLSDLSTYRFHEMRAASSWSVPSHAAMFSGRLPHRNGIHTYNRDFAELGIEQTWLSDLDSYRTAAVSANTFASAAFGFDSLFDACLSISPSCRFPEGLDVSDFVRNEDDEGIFEFLKAALKHDHPSKSVVNAALFKAYEATQGRPVTQPFDFGGNAIARRVREELESATEPVFMFANFMDAHSPHTPFRGLPDGTHEAPASFSSLDVEYAEVNAGDGLNGYQTEVEYIRQLYGGAVEYLDDIVADLITTVQENADREVVFVITSDHGENLGYEDDEWRLGHENSLSEGLLHVPFDVVSTAHNGETTDRTSLLDLGEIVRRLRDGEALSGIERDVVIAELAGHSGDGPEDGDADAGLARRAAYTGDRKVVWRSDGQSAVYDVSGEPNTQTEVDDGGHPDQFEDLFDVSLAEFVQQAAQRSEPTELDNAVANRLERLGYR